MDLLCKQIGLNIEGEARAANHGLISQILRGLRSYTFNGPVTIYGPGNMPIELDPESDKDYEEFLIALNILVDQQIISFDQKVPNNRKNNWRIHKRFIITVINRYKLERLRSELQWLGNSEDNRSEKPEVINLVYYDIKSGRGTVNGNKVYLKGRSKRLFRVLFNAAPNSVEKESLRGAVMYGHKYDPYKQAIQDAFRDLRKACKVDSTVITLGQVGGRLNAKAFPMSAQLFENTFTTENIPEKKPPK
jgi:hypothetical protein